MSSADMWLLVAVFGALLVIGSGAYLASIGAAHAAGFMLFGAFLIALAAPQIGREINNGRRF